MAFTIGTSNITSISEYTANVARIKTQAAIDAAKVVSDDQLAVKYKAVFDLIDEAAESSLYTITSGFSEVQRSELVPLLTKLGFTVTEKPVTQANSLSNLGAAPSLGSLSNSLPRGVASNVTSNLQTALNATNSSSKLLNSIRSSNSNVSVYLTISWE